MTRRLSDLLGDLGEYRVETDGYVAICPAHPDRNPSLRLALSGESLLLHCRAGCEKHQVLSALGLTPADLFDWEPGDLDDRKVAAGPWAEPPTANHITAISDYFEQAHEVLLSDAGVLARQYCFDRFGIDEEMAVRLCLGLSDGTVRSPMTGSAWNACPRLTVPFFGFDGKVRGGQARALTDHPVRWCGLTNIAGHRWSPLAVFPSDSGDLYSVITEGPSDGLTAHAARFGSVAIRGAALAQNPSLMAQLEGGLEGTRIVMAGDNDVAGQAFNLTIGERLAEQGFDVVRLEVPEQFNDLSDMRNADPAGFPTALQRAIRSAGQFTAPQAVVTPAAPAPAAAPLAADVLNARAVLAHADGNIHYVPGVGFLRWANTSWEVDSTKQALSIRRIAHAVGSELLQEAEVEPDDGIADVLAARGRALHSAHGIDRMIKELPALPGVTLAVEQLNPHHHLLAVKNGTVDLRSMELIESKPEHLCTVALDVDFNPDAVCPQWESFLDDIADGRSDMPGYLQRVIGYSLFHGTQEQCLFLLLGVGSNGKSVLGGTLASVFGPIHRTAQFSSFEERKGSQSTEHLARLFGSRIVTASEGSRSPRMDEATIKQITGGDRIACRNLYQASFEYQPGFSLFLFTNTRPQIYGQDPAIWRRIRTIEMTRVFGKDEQDRTLPEKLRDEAEGILAWAVRGAADWYANGLQDPEFVLRSNADYEAASDELNGFLPGVLTVDPSAETPSVEIYRLYTAWIDDQNLGRPWSKRAFNTALEERGIKKRVNHRRHVFWVGVRKTVESDFDVEVPDPAPKVEASADPLPVANVNPGIFSEVHS